MSQQKYSIFLIILALVFMVGSSTLFIVDETETAIVLQFGNPKKVHTDAGLKFKLPYPFQDVQYYDKRILNVDPDPERVNLASDSGSPVMSRVLNATPAPENAENKEGAEGEVKAQVEIPADVTGGAPILVDTFARFRITDPLKFLERLRTESAARAQIENMMESATRDLLGKTTLEDLLSRKRSEIMAQIRDRVNADMTSRGIEIVDIRIVRADLTSRLLTSTVNRMITERREQATKTRSTGQERALEIKSTADKEKVVLLAESQRDSQIIRGEGDREAIRIYAEAFNKDPDFYAFTRTMKAYRNTLSDPSTKLVLSPDSEFLRYFKDRK
jgi:membrane protease subunit HflC